MGLVGVEFAGASNPRVNLCTLLTSNGEGFKRSSWLLKTSSVDSTDESEDR